MSVIHMVLLGALLERPRNGYELKKEIEAGKYGDWVQLSTPSMYRNLVSLCRDGYLKGKVVRDGEMPEKTVYTVLEKGRRYFGDLMRSYAARPETVRINFTAVTSNLARVDEQTGRKLLEELRASFGERQEAYRALAQANLPFAEKAAADLNARMYALFIDWLREFERGMYQTSMPAWYL